MSRLPGTVAAAHGRVSRRSLCAGCVSELEELRRLHGVRQRQAVGHEPGHRVVRSARPDCFEERAHARAVEVAGDDGVVQAQQKNYLLTRPVRFPAWSLPGSHTQIISVPLVYRSLWMTRRERPHLTVRGWDQRPYRQMARRDEDNSPLHVEER